MTTNNSPTPDVDPEKEAQAAHGRRKEAAREAAIRAAMAVAKRVAESDLDVEVLALIELSATGMLDTIATGTAPGADAAIADLLFAVVGDVLGPPDPGPDAAPKREVWDLQQRIAVDVIACGGVTDDDLRLALISRDTIVGPWANIGADSAETPVPGLSATETVEQPPTAPEAATPPLHGERAAEPVPDDVIDAEVASTEIVPAGPRLVDELPSGQRRYRMPEGKHYNPRDTGIGGYSRTVTGNRPSVHLDTSDPHLGDRR